MKAKRMSFGAVGALFALLSLLLFVAACNGDDGDEDHTDPTATEPAAEDPTATESAAEDPTATEPVEPDPTAAEPTAEDPTAAEPTAEPMDEPEPTEPAEPDPTAAEPTVPAPSETTIDVSLVEFVIEPSIGMAPAGTITFNVSSEGIIFHNFKIVATGLSPDALPFDDALFTVDEEQVNIVASTADLDPGEQETLIVELAAGSYVLFCNIPTHYQVGMAVAFTVE